MKKNNFFDMLCNANYDYMCRNNVKMQFSRKEK